jgi:hypothetical protein
MSDETKAPKPHPSLVLMVKILQVVGSSYDAERGYKDAFTALEMVRTLLSANAPDEWGFSVEPEVPSIDLTPWLKDELFEGSR